jgi:hypothetical protein
MCATRKTCWGISWCFWLLIFTPPEEFDRILLICDRSVDFVVWTWNFSNYRIILLSRYLKIQFFSFSICFASSTSIEQKIVKIRNIYARALSSACSQIKRQRMRNFPCVLITKEIFS